MTFAAFSHVWSDGYGSVAEDGLPVCIVNRLSTYAMMALPTDDWNQPPVGDKAGFTLFWMDALCIPRDSPHVSLEELPLRKRAILNMAKIFECATATVVLDEDFMSYVPDTDGHCEDRAVGFMACKWRTRIWTLLECIRSRSLYVVTNNGYRMWSLEEFFSVSHDDQKPSPLLFMLYAYCVIMMRDVAAEENLTRMLQSMSGRTLSKPDDAVLALALLLKMPVDILLKQPDIQRRTELFWLNVPDLTRNMIFQRGPKLGRIGFRWANRSFLTSNADTRVIPRNYGAAEDMIAECTEDGLKAVYYVTPLALRVRWNFAYPFRVCYLPTGECMSSSSETAATNSGVAFSAIMTQEPPTRGAKRNPTIPAVCDIMIGERYHRLVVSIVQRCDFQFSDLALDETFNVLHYGRCPVLVV